MSSTKKSPIEVTEIALEKITELLGQRGKNSYGIRVGIKEGGCSGFEYCIEYADEPNPFDEVVECNSIKILIDPKAIMYLIGTTMDYIDDNIKSGFVFKNPNEKGRCGCGESFSI